MKGLCLRLDRSSVCAAIALCLALVLASQSLAQPRTEYRAFWVDTFNTNLNNHADVLTVVNNAKSAKANAIFAQVRRRGDSWYLNSLEPLGDRTPIQVGFDPLQDLIDTAHDEGIEVHAFVIMAAVWGRAPNLFAPENPDHVFNLHGGFNPATNTITPGPNNWLTRTLLADNAAAQISYQGHRFGSDFWVDFGHPDAAEYTVNVIDHLVRNYDIDGLHLDRIRYPEINVTGQTPSTGTSIGYNPKSVERFQTYYNIPAGSPPPLQNNPQWNQWRRDQVTNVVRRVYLNALSVNPQLKMSGAYIAFGGMGSTEASWNSAEAFWRVYQDWRAWTQEGITDIAIPMVYKAEHTATVRPQYDQWDAWLRGHLYDRAGMMGQGAANNAIEGTLRQARRTLIPPSTSPNNLSGIIFYSMATSNIAVTNNPFAIPSPVTTPARPFAELASGLTTGKSVNTTTLYEPAGLTPIFSESAQIPVFQWKLNPTVGHLKGFAKRANNSVLDTATVTITNLDTSATRSGFTDGGGFYGGVDLAPGPYLVKAVLGSDVVYSCVSNVSAGTVTESNLGPETVAPVTTAALSPTAPNGANGWYISNVSLSLSAADSCSGVARTEYSVNNGTTWQPYSGTIVISQEGTTTVLFRSVDRAGNIETAGSQIVMLDKSDPTVQISANPSTIWPPNGQMEPVAVSGSGADAVSGLSQVSYVVTDEYGGTFAIGTRSLSGLSANWAETLLVEALRNGEDVDGRLYTITATITDVSGRTSSAATSVTVLHDQRRGPE